VISNDNLSISVENTNKKCNRILVDDLPNRMRESSLTVAFHLLLILLNYFTLLYCGRAGNLTLLARVA
jgi:hypothetical protein